MRIGHGPLCFHLQGEGQEAYNAGLVSPPQITTIYTVSGLYLQDPKETI